jgi:hypothetical protein
MSEDNKQDTSKAIEGEVVNTDYRKNIIIESLENGATVISACEKCDINPATYYKWYHKDSKFRDRVEEAKRSRISIVEDALYKSAATGDTRAGIFILVNRGEGRWRTGFASNISINNTNRIDEGNKYDKQPDDFFERESIRRRQAISVRIDKKGTDKS